MSVFSGLVQYETDGEYFCDDARAINTDEVPDIDLICAVIPVVRLTELLSARFRYPVEDLASIDTSTKLRFVVGTSLSRISADFAEQSHVA